MVVQFGLSSGSLVHQDFHQLAIIGLVAHPCTTSYLAVLLHLLYEVVGSVFDPSGCFERKATFYVLVGALPDLCLFDVVVSNIDICFFLLL